MPLASAHPSAAAPNLARLTDGRLVCAFMTDEDWPWPNPPEDWWKRWDVHAEIKTVTSTDWGESWSPSFVVASHKPSRHCGWAGLIRLRDERLLCTFNSGYFQKNNEGTADYDKAERVFINYPQLLEGPALNDRFNGLNPDGTPFLWGLFDKWNVVTDGSHGNVFQGTQDTASYPWVWCGNSIWQDYSIEADIKFASESTMAGVILRNKAYEGYYECYVDTTRSPARFGLRACLKTLDFAVPAG